MIMTTKTSHCFTSNEDNEFDNTVLVIMTTKTSHSVISNEDNEFDNIQFW